MPTSVSDEVGFRGGASRPLGGQEASMWHDCILLSNEPPTAAV
jgi:hypothetical protein